MKKFFKVTILLLEFIFILVMSARIYPYIFTHENYVDDNTSTLLSNRKEINDNFPIAVVENGKVGIVKWEKYVKNPKSYKLLTETRKNYYELDEIEYFTIKKGKINLYEVFYETDKHGFGSSYRIENNIVIPNDFRMDGINIGPPFFIFTVFFMLIFNRMIKTVYYGMKGYKSKWNKRSAY